MNENIIEADCIENAKVEASLLKSDNIEALYIVNAIVEAVEINT